MCRTRACGQRSDPGADQPVLNRRALSLSNHKRRLLRTAAKSGTAHLPRERWAVPLQRAAFGADGSELPIAVVQIAHAVLGVLDGLLGLARRLIGVAFGLHVRVVGGVADASLDVALELFALAFQSAHDSPSFGTKSRRESCANGGSAAASAL